MTPSLVAACLLAAVAAAAAVRRDPMRRLRHPSRAGARRRGRNTTWRELATAGTAGLTVLLLLDGLAGVLAGPAAASLAFCLLRVAPRRADVLRQERLVRDLPFAVDLLAACLAAGASYDDALRAVAAAVPGALGELFAAVARGRTVGLGDRAWEPLVERTPPPVAAAGAALLRATSTGSAPAAELRAVAATARLAAAATAAATARRAGVLAVLPVACCFLPAFVLLGVVPLVATLLSGWTGG